MKVSWDNNSPYMEKNKIHVPNHQSVVLMKTYSVSLLLKMVKIPCWPVFAKSSAVFDAGSPMVLMVEPQLASVLKNGFPMTLSQTLTEKLW